MKKKPAKKFEKETSLKPFIATMAAESNLRKQEYIKNTVTRLMLNVLHLLRSVFGQNRIFQFDVPYCPVYGEILQDNSGKYYTTRAKRTGCMFGVHTEKSPNKFELMRETHPKLHDYCINKLGCGKVLDFIGVKY